MNDEFENMMRSQLLTLRNQMSVIKDYIDKYDQRNIKLRQTITNELIAALIVRFEKNEQMMQELNEKVDLISTRIQSNLDRSLKDLRDEISEAELSKAISKIVDDKEIKVSSRALQDLKEF
jgi:hypothetical protein